MSTVTNVDYDLDDLSEFEIPGATSVVKPTNVMTPIKEESLDPLDLDKPEPTPPVALTEDVELPNLDEELEVINKANGRPKNDKSGLVELYKKKIVAGNMVTFDDFDVDPEDKQYESKLEEYLSSLPAKDLEELWDANLTYKEQSLKEKIPQEFFESLPQELQFAAKYVADGGNDIKGLFRALSHVQEVKELDPDENPREVAQQYLLATNFGTEDEITEQLDEWEDLNVLGKKANAFKPKLDKMQEAIVEQKLAEQENQRRINEQRAKEYVKTVQDSLKTPDLGVIKLDNKTHNYIVNGLLDFSYDSVNGSKTNLLGALIEKHQVVEPNYKLIAEVTYLLSDPEGYRKKILTEGANQKTEQIVRKLKTEEGRRASSNVYEEPKNRLYPQRTSSKPANPLKRN